MSPLLFGLTLGGAAMYFFDPDRGRRRRALVRDKAVSASTCTKDFVAAGTRDLKNRGSAMTGRLKSVFKRRLATNEVLAERVRSQMGHHVRHPGAIGVHAAGGIVTLTGSILVHELPDLLAALGKVPDVTAVVDNLTVYETAVGISELQGGREPRRGNVMRPGTWSPGAQLVAVTTVGLLLLRQSSRVRGLLYLAAAGVALVRMNPKEQLQHLADRAAPDATAQRDTNAERWTAEEVS